MATAHMKRQLTDERVRTLSTPLLPGTLAVEVTYNQQVIFSHYVTRLCKSISVDRHCTFYKLKTSGLTKYGSSLHGTLSWRALAALLLINPRPDPNSCTTG
jgi:hypothetical protein